jgi:AraC-like DNA-binding protein
MLAMAVGVSMFLFISAPILSAFDGLSLLFHSRDLDDVIRSAHDMLMDKERAEKKLRDMVPPAPTQSLMRIFNPALPEAEARRLLSAQKMEFDFSHPFVCAVFERRLHPDSDADDMSWIEAAVDTLARIFPSFVYVSPGYHQLVCLAPSPDEVGLPQRLRDFLAGPGPGMAAGISCGLAFAAGGFSSLAVCFSQARSALRYRFQHPDASVFVYDHSMGVGPSMYEAIENLPSLPRGVLDRARLLEYRRSLESFLRTIESGPYLHPENIKSTLMQLLQNLHESAPPSWSSGIGSAMLNLFNAPDLGQASQVLLQYCDSLLAAAGELQDDPGSLIVQKAKSYISGNLDKDLSVQRIGEEVFMSRSHLSRLFFLKTGILLKDYILEERMNAACRLLQDPGLQIQDVGRSVGYPNTQSFIRSFKEKIGCTPGEYRRRLPIGA